MKTENIMLTPEKFAQVTPDEFLKVALDKMSESKIGIVCVVENKQLKGIITDGDIRRKLLNIQKPFSALFSDYVIDHAIKAPTVCSDQDSITHALELMEKNQIWDLPVLNSKNELVGLLHLHAVIKHLISKSD
tara:strand:+ start:6874 stop:7272 length:399 start_codon:yes stop_codon:yes gene_type:complete